MFRKKKGSGGVQGYDRISRLIEDRQREIAEGDDPKDELEDDTIVMRGPLRSGGEADEEESVSLLDVRGRGSESRAAVEPPPFAEPAAHRDEQSYAPANHGSDATAQSREASEPEPRSEFEARTPVHAEAMPVPDLLPVGGSSLVAADATWEGKLRSQGDIHVEGIFRGEVDTSATLVVAPKARIHGTVKARNVMLGGDVEGDISCEERLEILPGGSARGQINSGTLVVHEGAYIDSRFQMRQQAAPGA